MPKNLPCTSATKYKKHSAGKPLHKRKTTLEIPITFGSIIAVAQRHDISLKKAEQMLKIALQRHWVINQTQIIDEAKMNGNEAWFQYQSEDDCQQPELDDYDPADYL